MVSKLKQRIADVLFPGWRQNELVTSMLQHQARLRADPERQALNRRIKRQSRTELAVGLLASGVVVLCLMIGIVCWLAGAPPLTAIRFPLVQQLAAADAVSVVVGFLLVAR